MHAASSGQLCYVSSSAAVYTSKHVYAYREPPGSTSRATRQPQGSNVLSCRNEVRPQHEQEHNGLTCSRQPRV